jgi:hypothetical protein
MFLLFITLFPVRSSFAQLYFVDHLLQVRRAILLECRVFDWFLLLLDDLCSLGIQFESQVRHLCLDLVVICLKGAVQTFGHF